MIAVLREHLRERRRLLLISALVIVGAVFMAVAVGLIYGYLKFKPILDARLQERPHTNAVYSRPYELRVGQRLTATALSQELTKSGYRSGASAIDQNWFEVEPDAIRIHQVRFGGEELIAVRFDGSAISGIERGSESIDRISLQPRFLSNLLAKAREKRKYLRYEEFPELVIQAVLAAEDRNFFSHRGLDVSSLMRAAYVNVARQKSRAQWHGGSTITQQFIKNYFLTPEKNLRRKMEEAYLAVLVETRFTKEQIFEFYANEVYLGQAGSFSMIGLPQAADGYFGKSVKDLTLAETALLAGMIQAPNRFSPFAASEATVQRRNHILNLMSEHGFITAEEAEAASAEPIETVSSTRHLYTEAPYFVDFLSEVVQREIPNWSESENFEVHSTLDPELQDAAVEAVRQGMAKVDKALARKSGARPEAALVAVDPRNGDILAMVGGRNYAQTQFNRAVQAVRQPGSAFKPFVFAAALESGGHTLGTIVLDEPYRFEFGDEEYAPTNFGGGFRGNVTLRRALALSLNVPTVKVAEKVGYQSVANFSKKMGFSQNLRAFPSLALGTWEVSLLEVVQAYTAFANQGRGTRLRAIGAYAKDGVWQEVPVRSREVLSPQVAFLITSALESALNWGTGARARGQGFRMPAAGKTGSSNDSWFVGYTPDLLCAVWVGNDDFSDITLIGAEAALPIWVEFMKSAQKLNRLTGAKFETPSNIVSRQIDTTSGLLANFDCPNQQPEYFISGTQPTGYCYLNHEEEFDEDEDEDGDDSRITESEQKRGFWGRIFR
jgi:penicillin-binding protein 1B